MYHEDWRPLFGSFVVTIDKKARRKFGITEAKGRVKIAILEYDPEPLTEEQIVNEELEELEDIKDIKKQALIKGKKDLDELIKRYE